MLNPPYILNLQDSIQSFLREHVKDMLMNQLKDYGLVHTQSLLIEALWFRANILLFLFLNLIH